MIKNKRKFSLTYTQIILIGFLCIILLGACLLTLPVSTRHGNVTSFYDALFTATSATCVTGLVVYDTYTHWTAFGHGVIIFLIQIGGLGFMAIITMFSMFFKRKISLHERKLIMQASGTIHISGVVHLIRRILIGTFLFEGIGAVLLAIRFVPKMGFTVGICNAIFHSVSAFCNAGFDLMGRYEAYSSLMLFADDVVVNFTIMALIIIGGLGFLVWDDIAVHKLHFKKYELHTKIVVVASASLIIIPAFAFYAFEYNGVLAGKSLSQQILESLFQVVSPRTAGFNTVDLNELSDSSNLLTVFLMLVGGSPGSTAGGIKTTTFVVLLMNVVSSARRHNKIEIFKRTLDDQTVKQAGAIITVYLTAICLGVMLICAAEPYTMKQITFEATSAIGTVGLSMGGVTPYLSDFSRGVLILMMYSGRVGGLTLMLALAEKRVSVPSGRPEEKILIG